MKCVDAEPFLLYLVNWQMECFSEVGKEEGFSILQKVINALEMQPEVTPDENVKTGTWIPMMMDIPIYGTKDTDRQFMTKCSNCDSVYTGFVNSEFCSHCGAKMR